MARICAPPRTQLDTPRSYAQGRRSRPHTRTPYEELAHIAAANPARAASAGPRLRFPQQRSAHAKQTIPLRNQAPVGLKLCLKLRQTLLDLRDHVIVMPIVTVPRNRTPFDARFIQSQRLVVRAPGLLAPAGGELSDEVRTSVEHMFDDTASLGRFDG